MTNRTMSTPLHERTLGRVLREKAKANGDRTFLLFEGERYSYADAYERSRQFAAGLTAAGIAPGQHVAIMMENRAETVWLNFALALIGVDYPPPIFTLLGLRQTAESMGE